MFTPLSKSTVNLNQLNNVQPLETNTVPQLKKQESPSLLHPHKLPTAIIYCEANFAKVDGKTANGLVRHSQNYRILSVIDSHCAGLDSGQVLDNAPNNIPVVANITQAMIHSQTTPDYFIYGIAPSSGLLTNEDKDIILNAMSLKMNIINGLHEFLNDDPTFIASSKNNRVSILDIRKPNTKHQLHTFTGDIHSVDCPRIAVMGTDCALGKRTTATILANALQKRGLKVVMIATGQTGIMQGAPYSVALDAVPSQFCAGELESVIVKAYQVEKPDIIIIEGQGALSHPAFSTSSFILRGSCPTGVILQHAPKRQHRIDFPNMPMPTPATEINLIETFADTKVIGITLNHQDMTTDEVLTFIDGYSKQFDIPVTDALSQPIAQLLHIVKQAYPQINDKLANTE
ncbi:DUF1611 domain-containing protein [Shewanella gaetbuli]|uniref:DUF1611 domain-containing protein n=1 Tax=Shewanella gaetbuli TaxID=220752 RepID=A0A9X1ZJT8_9GAMM|nr:DUF1611 domain-containing protein [Shewanella gaetbuli]MCL1143604.1 DUF1611 domain-containing protein [Shewanella gaetbuli]